MAVAAPLILSAERSACAPGAGCAASWPTADRRRRLPLTPTTMSDLSRFVANKLSGEWSASNVSGVLTDVIIEVGAGHGCEGRRAGRPAACCCICWTVWLGSPGSAFRDLQFPAPFSPNSTL